MVRMRQSTIKRTRPSAPEILGLPFVCLACGGQIEAAASERTRKHRRHWLCTCTPLPDCGAPQPSKETA